MFPVFLSYVLDDPESKAASCIKGGNTEYPCELCNVPKAELSSIKPTGHWPMRFEKDQKVRFNYSLSGRRELPIHQNMLIGSLPNLL